MKIEVISDSLEIALREMVLGNVRWLKDTYP